MSDETTDIKNRKVLNTLIAPAEDEATFRIVSTQFLKEGFSAATIANGVSDSVRGMGIDQNRVIGFKSDNAPTMLCAGRTLSGLYPR